MKCFHSIKYMLINTKYSTLNNDLHAIKIYRVYYNISTILFHNNYQIFVKS